MSLGYFVSLIDDLYTDSRVGGYFRNCCHWFGPKVDVEFEKIVAGNIISHLLCFCRWSTASIWRSLHIGLFSLILKGHYHNNITVLQNSLTHAMYKIDGHLEDETATL